MYYRHGDVLFERIEVAPSDSRRTQTEDEKTEVVQRGESTGHAHIIDDMAGIDLFSVFWERFLSAGKKFTITHEEHKSLTIPAGNYRIHIAREYDYLLNFEKEIRD
jgi:hypothetical protein